LDNKGKLWRCPIYRALYTRRESAIYRAETHRPTALSPRRQVFQANERDPERREAEGMEGVDDFAGGE